MMDNIQFALTSKYSSSLWTKFESVTSIIPLDTVIEVEKVHEATTAITNRKRGNLTFKADPTEETFSPNASYSFV